MARPTPDELSERRARMQSMNQVNSGALMAQNTGGPTSPALAGQPASITGQQEVAGAAPPSGPVGSGNSAPNVNTPVAGDAPQTQPAGPDLLKDRGSPADIVADGTRKDPQAQLKVGQETEEALKNTKANNNGQSSMQGVELNKNLTENGVNIPKGFQDLQDEIYKGLKRGVEDDKITKAEEKKLRKGWRKVFNHVNEDEMGLFLIDFGMRAMMAGETMGSAGAIGAAGSGALGALQGRRQSAADEETAMQQTAFDQATGRFESESDRMKAGAAVTAADAQKTRAGALGKGYAGEKSWMLDLGRSIGRKDDEMFDIFAGVKTEGETRDFYRELIAKRIADAQASLEKDPTGNLLREQFDSRKDDFIGKPFYEFTAADQAKWVENMIKAGKEQSAFSKAESKYNESKNGALQE